jgi:hypothetical protein
MQKALEQMNVKLAEVVSDITGATGQRIMAAILEGERDPRALAGLRDPKCKNDAAKIEGLEGTWRPEHLFALKQLHELYHILQWQIAACDAVIRAKLGKLPDRAGGRTVATKPHRCGRKPNDLSFDACGPLFQSRGVDLTEVEGIDVGTGHPGGDRRRRGPVPDVEALRQYAERKSTDFGMAAGSSWGSREG